MSDQVASLFATLDLNTSGFERGLQGAKSGLAGFGQELKQAAVTVGLLAAFNLVTRAASNFAQSLRAVGAEALTAYASYERMGLMINQLAASQILAAGGAKDMTSALEAAKRPAQDILDWAQALAIKSPFQLQDVTQTTQMLAAMGFSIGEAKRTTQAFADWAAAAGVTGDTLKLVAINMGQVASMGKLSGREVRDFAMHGLPAVKILADEFGVTTAKMQEMISDGAVPAGKAIEALVSYMETNFKGAAERQAYSWAGLTSSLADVKEQALRLASGGIFQAIQPEVGKLVDFLSSDSLKVKLANFGNWLGQGVGAGVKTAWAIVQAFTGDSGPLAGIKDMFSQPMDMTGIQTTMSELVATIATSVITAFTEIQVFLLQVKALIDGVKGALDTLRGAYNGFTNFGTDEKMSLVDRIGSWLRSSSGQPMFKESSLFAGAGPTWPTWGAGAGTGASAAMGPQPQTLAEQIAAMRANAAALIAAVQAGATSYQSTIGASTTGTGLGKFFGKWGAAGGAASSAIDDILNAGKAFLSGADGVDEATSQALDKVAKAMDSFAKSITASIDTAAGNAKKLFDATGGSGGAGSVEPGAGSWAEPFYRIADVAASKQRGMGADTAKWMEMYFSGLDVSAAQGQAAEISKQFQMGNLLAPGVFEKIDWQQMAAGVQAQQEASKISTYAGQAAAGLVAAGKPLTSENMQAMIEQLAKADEDQIVPSLQGIDTSVLALKDSQETSFAATLEALKNLPSGIAAALSGKPPSASGAAGSGNTETPINGKLASGALYTRPGSYLVGEQGPEIVQMPAGARVYAAQQTSALLSGGLLQDLASEIQARTAGASEAVGALAEQLVTGATNSVLRGMLRTFARG